MTDKPKEKENQKDKSLITNEKVIGSDKDEITSEKGDVSKYLTKNKLDHETLPSDHLGIEIIKVEPNKLFFIAEALKNNGFDYLQCQGGYDEGPGKNLVCFYNLVAMGEVSNFTQNTSNNNSLREVRLKVFLDRNSNINVPSLYKLFKGSDWQERETYDMFGINFQGHPHPKRLLMPEDWKGWPLRKDYVQPDFYEMQDAY